MSEMRVKSFAAPNYRVRFERVLWSANVSSAQLCTIQLSLRRNHSCGTLYSLPFAQQVGAEAARTAELHGSPQISTSLSVPLERGGKRANRGECKAILIIGHQASLVQAPGPSRSEILDQPLAQHGIAKCIALHAIRIQHVWIEGIVSGITCIHNSVPGTSSRQLSPSNPSTSPLHNHHQQHHIHINIYKLYINYIIYYIHIFIIIHQSPSGMNISMTAK
jgi:hypothetical protein